MRFIPAIKIHSPVVCWLFVLLEILLMSYQLFQLYAEKDRNRDLIPLLLTLALVIWNCTFGALWEVVRFTVVNIATLMFVVLLMFIDFINRPVKVKNRNHASDLHLPEDRKLDDVMSGKMDVFVQRCKEFGFTQREIETADLARQGFSYKQIAEKLFVSAHTIDGYHKSMYKKAGVNNKAALIYKLTTSDL